MMISRFDAAYRFFSWFDPETGLYVRSNVLDDNGDDTGQEPFLASSPHLLDIGIMGHCEHGALGFCIASGVQCYQDGLNRWMPNMTVADFQRIAAECAGTVYQVALGGRGDPDMHEDFEAILACCRENSIVPNVTTSGFGLTAGKARLIKRYCGAAAVSWYRSKHTFRALELLLEAGVRTNIHFVLGNQSIDEALDMMENNKIPEGIGRVIFLLHKPVGLGTRDNVLDVMDARVQRFFGLFDDEANCQRAGFDSCCVPGLVNMTVRVHPASLEPCEGARFSAYISPDMRMVPCSFDQELRWAVDLKGITIKEAWNSTQFAGYRSLMQAKCPECGLQQLCLGGCPIAPEITLCGTRQGRD